MQVEVSNIIKPTQHFFSSDGFACWDIYAGSRTLEKIFYQMIMQQSEFESPHCTKKISCADAADAMDILRRHSSSKGEQPFEVLFRCSDKHSGASFIFCRGEITEWDEYGNPLHMTGCSLDVTNVVDKRNELSIRNEQQALAIDGINAGVWAWEIATGKEWWSDKLSELLGYAPGEIKPAYDTFLNMLLHPDDKEMVLAALNQHFEKQTPYLLEIRMLNKDGNYYWYETAGKASFSNDMKPLHMAGSIIPRHKKKMLEIELKKYKELVDEMSSMTKTGGWEFHKGAKMPLWTKAVFDIHEVSYDEQPDVESAINFYCDESKQIISAAFAALSEHGTPYDLELEMITAKGKKIWVRTIGKPMLNIDGQITGATGTLQNITERKQREIELMESNKIIAEQNARLQNFAHIVTHNLRSHAGNLQSVLHLAKNTEDVNEKTEMMGYLEKISSSLSNTIADLTEIVKAESSKELAASSISFEIVLKNVCNVLAPVINNTGVVIESSFSGCSEVNYVPAYLESILFNLVSNAIKYRHPQRNPAVKIITYMEGNRKCLSVTDNGVGIDMTKHKEKIFGMYKTFHKHPDARGIGLFITKNMVETMGGKIFVNSTPGEGTTFTVKF